MFVILKQKRSIVVYFVIGTKDVMRWVTARVIFVAGRKYDFRNENIAAALEP